MPSQLDLDKIIADNPDVDLEEFKKGEEALKSLHRTGTVRRSTYELDTPESKREIRQNEDTEDRPSCAPAFRRLRHNIF
jgi:hypothetical protein